MKYFILPFVLIIFRELPAQGQIHGKINNLNNLNDTVFKIVFIQDKVRKDSTHSKTAGFYSHHIKSGLYDIEISKKNHVPIVLKGVSIRTGSTSINFCARFNMVKPAMANTAINNNVKVKPGDVTVIMTDSMDFDGTGIKGKGTVLEKEEVETFKTRSYSYESVSPAPAAKKTAGKASKSTWAPAAGNSMTAGAVGSGSDSKSKTGFRKAEPEKDMAPALKEDALSDSKIEEKKPDVKAGQVTAGHWRDIDHWSQWEETHKDAGIAHFQQIWGYFPKTMMKVSFEDKDQKSLSYTAVILLDKDNRILWQGKTDQDGHAWFWPGLFESNAKGPDKIKVIKDKHEKIIQNIQPYINSKNRIKVDFENRNEHLLEIGFVVDATGSMGDEIKFLQVELMDVINRVQKKNRCLNVQTGAVFYKDLGDDYLTRILPLSANPANTINFIGYQSANGGGDFPEAIDVAMQDAVTKLNWSQTDNPKIMFLLLDAPPHQDSASKNRMRIYTRMAAERGIRIVPIAASGIDKTTEFLLKYIAIATNGEYVYITDDSKIGNTHLKPTGGESKVTYLNDLMVDIINRYSEGKWCREELPDSAKPSTGNDSLLSRDSSQQQQQNHTEIIAGSDWYMKFYPNPAAYNLQVYFSETAERLKITDLSGKVMFEAENRDNNGLSIDISSWSTGIYLVYAVRSNETISGKLLVMH